MTKQDLAKLNYLQLIAQYEAMITQNRGIEAGKVLTQMGMLNFKCSDMEELERRLALSKIGSIPHRGIEERMEALQKFHSQSAA